MNRRQPTLLLSVAASLAFATSAWADASAYIVHAIPGEDVGLDPALPVDITLNGSCDVTNLQYGDILGPIPIPADTYDIVIRPANEATPCSEDGLIFADGVVLEDDVSYSIVAHLDADGAPTASVFINDIETDPGKSTVNLFHAAAAPTVDVKFRRDSRFFRRPITVEDVSNGDNAAAQVFAGDYTAKIFPAGERKSVFGPAELSLDGDRAYLVYAVGSLESGTFTLFVKAVDQPASIVVVHAVPGEAISLDPSLPVDIALNGACTLENFTFGSIAGPVDVLAGTYDIDISAANLASPCSEPALIEADGVELEGGVSYSITANLDESGAPVASVFENNVLTGGPFALVNVFHIAEAPTVDLLIERVNTRFAFPRFLDGVSNGDSGSLYLFEGDFDVSILPAMMSDPVFGPVELPFDGGFVYLIYAIGSLNGGTFDVVSTAFEVD